ncbi:MAG: hypothetical protein EP309_08835 [Gammaproteobacteria bacterium]|jgi:hypothetical protein|nr:hypothetical protein [Candidatus Thioaporhodococcus sediminis]TNF52636.1 MAG: hypothetical protein EP309_08835 [Gammaproteobacteria bacterium]
MVDPLNDSNLQGIVEAICAKGCRRVWRDIAALEAGNPPIEAQGLSRADRDRLLAELKAIMAVYDSCRSAPEPSPGPPHAD